MFALLYWLSPIELSGQPKFGIECNGAPGCLLTLQEAFVLSIHASRPFADVGFAAGSCTALVAIAQGFVVPAQFAMLVLAIRNSVRRR